MSRSNFVFLCCIVFVSNQCFAKKWCSRNALESLLQCLTEDKFIPHMESFEILNQRIACSKIGDCTPKLFQVWNKKIRLVRKYGKCMKNSLPFLYRVRKQLPVLHKYLIELITLCGWIHCGTMDVDPT